MKRPANTLERRVWLGFVVVAAVALAIGWLVYANSARLHRDHDAVARQYEALYALEATLSSLQDVETGQRGYLLTDNPAFLAPYNDGLQRVDEHLAHLRALTVEDPLQQVRLASLEALATEKIRLAREAIDIHDRLGDEAADRFTASGRGQAVLDEVRAVVRNMQETETEHLQRRTHESDVGTRNTTILTGSLAVLSLALFAVLLVAITRSLASQRCAAEAERQAAHALRESQQRWATVFNLSPAAISITRLQTLEYTDVNNAFARLFGYSPEEVIGRTPLELGILPDAAEINLLLERLVQGGVVRDEELALRHRSGGIINALTSWERLEFAGESLVVASVIDITERKQAEQALRESQHRFATIFHASPVALAITRLADSVLIDADERYLDLFGFTRDEVIGRTTVSLGIFDDLTQRAAVLDRLRTEPAVRDVEMQFRSRSGQRIDAVLSMEVVELDGQTCVLSVVNDITARKEAEEERDRVFTLSSDLIAVAGFDGLFRRVNPAVTETLGYSVDEILGRPFLDILHPDDRPGAVAETSRLQAGERSVTFQGRAVAKDGSYHWVEMVASADPDRQLIYAVARDVTGRMEIQEALRASEERFRSVVETATDAIVIADRLGNIEVFNQAAEQMFGYTAAEAAGQNVNILIPSPQKEEHDGAIAAFHARGTSEVLGMRREMVGQRKDGSLFPHDLTVNAMRLGDEVKFAAIMRDTTERKQLETEIREAKEAAEEANRAKSAFLSRMSHELRTPLNVVLGFGQVLQLDPLDPPQAEAVDYIIKAGRHLLELIDEVLDISRIEAGRLSLSIEAVHADELLSDSLALMRPLAEQRHITLRAGLDACAEYVLADRQRIKQVLLNLLANAIKYNHEGGAVDVSCTLVDDSSLRIMITDTGPGIAPDKIERLFVAFDRLGAEASAVEGTGLGLTLSRHLVEAMGGAIGVESAVGMGSTFWVELPLGAPPDGPETKTEAVEQDEFNRNRGGRSILYVEDNLANLKLMERVLTQQKGFHLLAAMQGRLGIELARDHRPDLILLDLHLPDMLGSDVLRELKTHPATVDIPVVIISADASPGQAARLLDAGARAYLTKPLDLKEFLELTDSILREES